MPVPLSRPPGTTVINIHRTNVYDEKIDRTTIFGNPFRVEKFGRAECIRRYEQYFYARLERDPAFKVAVLGLKGKVLACWCKPEACHGDVICDYLNSLDYLEKIQQEAQP